MSKMAAARCGLLAMLVLAVGCRMRFRSYDKPPQRSLLEDRWSGYYFDQVHASYSIPLYNPAPSLRRDFHPPVPVFSSNPQAPKSISALGGTAPTCATVTIEYLLGSEKPSPRTLKVTLHWPRPEQNIASGQSELSETRVVSIGNNEIREFLEESGEFRVERDDHYFRHESDVHFTTDGTNAVSVPIRVAGPNKAARVDSIVEYQNVAHLYKLVDEVWPGAK